MEHPLVTYFSQYLTLNEEEKAYLIEHVQVKEFKKHTTLLEEGNTSTAFYFVVEGLIRMYYLVEGIEKTTFFYGQHDFVSSFESFTKQTPSTHYFETLQDTRVAVFDHALVTDILTRFPRFDILARIAMEEELSVCQKMIASFVTLNAEQRYLQLMKEKPALLQQIPQYHIATYLGVSPETLSRIRNRISHKNVS